MTLEELQEELQEDYRRKRRLLEEEEDSLRSFKKKGEQIAEQAENSLRQSLNGLAKNNEPLVQARRVYQMETEHYQESLVTERRQILQKLDDLERDYQESYRNFHDC